MTKELNFRPAGFNPEAPELSAKEKKRIADREYRARKKAEREAERAAKGLPPARPGRPRKTEVAPVEERMDGGRAGAPTDPAQLDLEREIEAMREEAKADADGADEDAGPEPAPAPAPAPAPLITGYLLLIAIDAIAPGVIVLLLRTATGRRDVTADALRLGPDDRKAVEPLADEAAKYISGRLNPVTALAVVLGSLYAMRIPPESPEARTERMKRKAERKAERKARRGNG